MSPNDARIAQVRGVLAPNGRRPDHRRSKTAVTARWLRELRYVSASTPASAPSPATKKSQTSTRLPSGSST